MAYTYIYPTGITPKVLNRCVYDNWWNNKGGCKDIQPLTKDYNWNNVCKDNDNIISWGEKNPDAVDKNNPVYSSNFYNTITTYSGSYDTGTPFTTNGWNYSEQDIPDVSKLKRVVVEYVWDQVKYVRSNNNVTWKKGAVKGHYQSAGGYFKYGPVITLKIGGKNITTTGPSVNSANSCTLRNTHTYKNSDLKSCKIELYGVNGLTMKDFRNSKLTFAPPKNYGSDVTRIVMRYIRVWVEYEPVPGTFNITELSSNTPTITNCENAYTTLKIKLNNNAVSDDTTEIHFTGSGVTNGNIKTISKNQSDFFEQDDDVWIWKVNEKCKQRELSLDISYYKCPPGVYSITANVVKNKGKETTKNIDITVKSCKPTFDFNIYSTVKGVNYTNRKEYNNITDGIVNAQLVLTLQKNQLLPDDNEYIEIDTDKLECTTEDIEVKNGTTIIYNKTIKQISCIKTDTGYRFGNIQNYNNLTITIPTYFEDSGIFNIVGSYINTTQTNWNTKISRQVHVIGASLSKDYFKLRLEDGSDVRYNSLMITKGDDLLQPLTYTSEDIDEFVKKMKIYGETKRIPVNETQYVHFTIELDTDEEIELKNVLTYIEIHGQDYENIIVGAGKGVKLLETSEDYVCSIDSISSTKPTKIKLAVRSSIEIDDVIIKIKPYNYDGYEDEALKWIPTHVMFKDIPNIKISIEGISDLIYDESNPNGEDIFWLYYKIQNLSDTKATNIRFQLKEPLHFIKKNYELHPGKNNNFFFNTHNRIITFEKLEARSAENILAVQYQATKRGIYDFIIHTVDDPNDLTDEQYSNSYTHELMVNIPNDVRITTDVSKNLVYINEMFDFHIKVKNLHKKQKYFKFDIYDIGSYDIEHNRNDYEVKHIKCEKGTFNINNDENNKIGEWELNDIDINDEYHLTLSVIPQDTGIHTFKTIFSDQFEPPNQKDFYNEVKVIEKNKQLEFNVYHAIDENGNGCNDCDSLTEICDDDFINLGDDIYYVFEIKNKSHNPITNPLNIYARLPNSFLTNNILCSSYRYTLNNKNNLISFTIPQLEGCLHDNSEIKFCIKVKPSDVGKFNSNFSLSTKNAHVLYKQLHLTVDTEFNNRKLEHEIKIYNFEKTNQHYRYEIDNVGQIFKFFNTGDKTLRPIDIEGHSASAIEVYKGTNLKHLLRDISNKSKYVDPLYLKDGNNKLANKGYQLFPDGLIRRFGLLNSEIYHYSGQFPSVTDLVDRAMKWDIDSWDTKLWAGGKYDNGIFGLSIDYTKVPSNFNILDVDYPIKNLQSLVDNVKPYGTKAICNYAATVNLDLGINVKEVKNNINNNIDVHMYMPDDFTLSSLYNKFDDTISVYYDLMSAKLRIEIDKLINFITTNDTEINNEKISSKIDTIYSHIFKDAFKKVTIDDCYNLVADIYNKSEEKNNIDIIKNYNPNNRTRGSGSIQVMDLENNIDDKEEIGFIIKTINTIIHNHVSDDNDSANNNIRCIFTRDDINNFNGFKIILNDKTIYYRNINKKIKNISMQIQTCIENDNNILHFWGSINNENYYHIGLLTLDNIDNLSFDILNKNDREIQEYNWQQDEHISFKISDKIKKINKQHSIIQSLERDNKWQYLKNINKNNNKYAYYENNIDISKECDKKDINIPKLLLKYDNIDIDDLDEVVDIEFKIEAQTNKDEKDFMDNVNINLYKDGDKYIPTNNIAKEICYPTTITNINQEFLATMELEEENMTICSNCLKTSLGYYEKCPHCHSSRVTYSNEKTPATACYNCGWIINGWNDYCKHCLSFDVEKIQIDYNKTYCDDCGTLSNDYYEHCPQCFSKNVTHLTNNVHKYTIFDEDKQNIEPIHINIAENDAINIFSLRIPLNKKTNIIKELEYLKLTIHGTNNNDGKYYYCDACNSGGVGNYETCPYCGSNLIHNESIQIQTIIPYYEAGGINQNYINISDNIYDGTVPIGNFTKEIDLLTCAYNNPIDKFKLTFILSSEYQSYNDIRNKILNLPIKDEYQGEILDAILPYNIIINNLSLDYRYKDEQEWVNLDKLEGPNHTGIKYHIINNKETDKIKFSNFTIKKGKYKRASLYINGLLKNINDYIVMNIKIYNDEKIYKKNITITDVLFNYNYNILEDIGDYIGDLSVELSFTDGTIGGEIIITDCNITVENTQYRNDLSNDINKIMSNCKKENNYYIFNSGSSMWGLNDTRPYYLSGKQLSTNLVGYIDFGKLSLEEYIRVYNIDMIIYYKNKSGHFTTETFSSHEANKTLEAILYSNFNNLTEEEIKKAQESERSLKNILIDKGIYIDYDEVEQQLCGQIKTQNGALWGSINYPEEALNNLESEITNINENDELISAIPLQHKIAQSFNTGDNISSISKINIDYFGKRGYPNSIINVYLCKDNDGKPGNIIASSQIETGNINEVLNVDLNAYNLQLYTQYWIVLEDISADVNNYHRFSYNNNLSVGHLLTYKDDKAIYQDCVLSFSIDKIRKDKTFYQLPITWMFLSDRFDGYKIHNTLYRYNVQEGSNVSLSEFAIKGGYVITDNGDKMIEAKNKVSVKQIMKLVDKETNEETYLILNEENDTWERISKEEYDTIRGNSNG